MDDTDELLRYNIGEGNQSIHSNSRISGSFMRYGGGSKLSNHHSSSSYPGQHDNSYHMNGSSPLSNSPQRPTSYHTNRYDLSSTQRSLRNTSLHQVSALDLDGSASNQSLLQSDTDQDGSRDASLEGHGPDRHNGTHGQYDLSSSDSHSLDHLDNDALVKRTQKLLDQTLESYDQDVNDLVSQWKDNKYQGYSRKMINDILIYDIALY